METLFSMLLACVFYLVFADAVDALPDSMTSTNARWQLPLVTSKSLSKNGNAVAGFLQQFFPRTTRGTLGVWEMVQITTLCGALPGIWYLQRYLRRKSRNDSVASSWRSTAKLHPDVSLNEDESTGWDHQSSKLLQFANSFKMQNIRIRGC